MFEFIVDRLRFRLNSDHKNDQSSRGRKLRSDLIKQSVANYMERSTTMTEKLESNE